MAVKPGWARKRPNAARPLPPATEQPQSAQAPEEQSLWRLNRDEQRTLIITFIGGLASIVAAACVLGGAIALDRWIAHNNHGHIDWRGEAVTSAILVLGGGFVLYFVRGPNMSKRWNWTVTVVYGLLLALVLLLWIGLAAGIH
jgi:hypothetical protein